MTVFSHLSNAEFVSLYDEALDAWGEYFKESPLDPDIMVEAIRRLRESAEAADAVDEIETSVGKISDVVSLLEDFDVSSLYELREALETQKTVDASNYTVGELVQYVEYGRVAYDYGFKNEYQLAKFLEENER